MTRPADRRADGFTLVEVMVALLIFGMIAAAGTAILAFSVRAQGAATGTLDDIGSVNRLSAILTADLAQAQDRPTRDETGTLLPAFTGGVGLPAFTGGVGLPAFTGGAGSPMLRLVRGGWSNIDAAPRGTLQKVEYRLDAGRIERVGYPALDGAAPLPAAVLVEGVRQAAWRFRYQGAWSDRWDGAGGVALPQAAELVMVRADGRAYRLLFLVGSPSPQPIPTNAPTPGPTPGTPPQRGPGSRDG